LALSLFPPPPPPTSTLFPYTTLFRSNPALNAYVAVTADQARAMAKASDERRAAGTSGPLEGVPLGIKDLFGTKGAHTQAGSHIRSEEHTSELQSRENLVCRLLLEKNN